MLERHTILAQGGTGGWWIHWGAVVAGALTGVAVGLVLSLAGVAIGAVTAVYDPNTLAVAEVGFWGLVWNILFGFLGAAAGGWMAARVAGTGRAESSILHGFLSWTLALPLLIILSAAAALPGFGGWLAGAASLPAFLSPEFIAGNPEAATEVIRDLALGAVTAMLVSLVGAVIGAWVGSEAPMTAPLRMRVVAVGEERRPPAGTTSERGDLR